MSDRRRHGFGQPRVLVRETDDYVERTPTAGETRPPNSWDRRLMQPATLGLLVACVVWPVAQLISRMPSAPGFVTLLMVPVLMSLVGLTTQHIVVRRLLSGSEGLRFRLVELGVLFLGTKLAALASLTVPELGQAVRAWSASPLAFFDTGTVITYAIGVACWWMGTATAQDLDAVRDPSLYVGETDPRQRLTKRYFIGGAILMFFAAINRVNLISVVTLTQQRTRSPIVSALVYFLAGLLMLGQIRIARLLSLWRRDRVAVSPTLRVTWPRYLAILLAVAACVAFVLPTGYTIGLLDLTAYVLQWALALLAFLFMIITLPLSWLASLFLGGEPQASPGGLERPPLEPPMATAAAEPGAWWAVLRSALFWVVLGTTVIYLVRSYIRDHPGIGEALRGFAPLAWLGRVWSSLRRWLRRAGKRVGRALPSVVARLRAARAERRSGRRHGGGTGPRERVIRRYLETIDLAGESGATRHVDQTPYEYRPRLDEVVQGECSAVTGLTEAFIEARYSDHEINAAQATETDADAERIQRALRRPDQA